MMRMTVKMISTCKRWKHRCLAVCMCLVFALGYTTMTWAATPVDTTRSCSLTVEDQIDNKPVAGVEFKLYLVGKMTSAGAIKMEAEFSTSKVTLKEEDSQEDWSKKAASLEVFVGSKEEKGETITPVATQYTDEKGETRFTNLVPGAYLLIGGAKTIDGVEYTTVTSLVSLPYEQEDGRWDYVPTVNVKSQSQEPDGYEHQTGEDPVPEETTTPGTEESTTPEEVTEPENPEETTDPEETTEPENPEETTQPEETQQPEETTTQAETEETEEPTTKEDSIVPTNPSSTPPSTTTKLPQTGQLWWPLPLLSLAGMLFILTGWKLCRKPSSC
jgi:hypothetical protein